MLPSYYHTHHSHYQEDLPFWLSLAAQFGDPVLELGCGTGRVLIPIAQAGHRCIGMDRDLSMLVYLQAGISPDLDPRPQIILADITWFNLATKLPLVILPCNTFSTLDARKRRACLRSIYRVMQPGGVFALSIPNPATLRSLPARSEAELEDKFYHPQTGNPVQVSSSWLRNKRNFRLTWYYDHLQPDGTVERHEISTLHHLISLEAYISEIQEVRMVVTHIYGDFDRSEYGENSPHCIITALRE